MPSQKIWPSVLSPPQLPQWTWTAFVWEDFQDHRRMSCPIHIRHPIRNRMGRVFLNLIPILRRSIRNRNRFR